MNAIARRQPPPPRIEREYVDFSVVPAHQVDVHERLDEWRRWCRMRPNQTATPMFRLHQSDAWEQREYGSVTAIAVERTVALRIAKLLHRLPDKHRHAIQWYYLRNARNPRGQAQALAMSVPSLAQLVIDARQMILNLGG